jgi:hypothetical protein
MKLNVQIRSYQFKQRTPFPECCATRSFVSNTILVSTFLLSFQVNALVISYEQIAIIFDTNIIIILSRT